MRRHVIIGRFGPLDREGVPAEANEVSTFVDLATSNQRLGCGIGQALDALTGLGVFPSEIGLDLLILAAHVHAADTRISRKTESQDTWTREVRVVVPVSDPDRWLTTVPVLKRMLNFLTGDYWEVGFRSRPRDFATVIPVRAEAATRPAVFDDLSLFSGGLDSLIGAIDVLAAGRIPLLVSHAGEGATSDAQRVCYDVLQNRYRRRPFSRIRIWMNFRNNLVRGVRSENTTRGRSFLFFAAGVFAGTGLDSPVTLRVPENGLIALNVPLDPLRLGSLSTRTTHPYYMARWNELLHGLDIPVRVENPYWNKTKGEMVAGCANQDLLRQLIPGSISCSSPAKGRWQGLGTQHCGYCVPCLIRRGAIEHALGRGADRTPYTIPDLTDHILNTRRAEGQQVRAFQYAIERLRARPDLAKFLIHKPGPLSDVPGQLDELAGVYRRGMEEVAAVLAGVQTAAV